VPGSVRINIKFKARLMADTLTFCNILVDFPPPGACQCGTLLVGTYGQESSWKRN